MLSIIIRNANNGSINSFRKKLNLKLILALFFGLMFFSSIASNKDNALKNFRKKIGNTRYSQLFTRLGEVNADIKNRGVLFDSISKKELITGYEYGQFYDWDLYFENIYLSYYGISKFNFRNLEAFFMLQQSDGFIKRSFGPKDYGKEDMFKPFIAQIVLLGSLHERNYQWAKDQYSNLKKYLEKWFSYDDDKNGLVYWPGGAYHSGMDNQFTRCVGKSEGADLNCYLVRELQAMAVISDKLGMAKEREEFLKRAKALSDLINKNLWDSADGFYYDRDELTGKLTKVKSVAGFTPLWAKIASKEQAKILVTKHLQNPEEFWVNYPLASYAKSEPDYYQKLKYGECNWRGPAWIPINYMVCHGLVKYGYKKIAIDLAYRTFDLVLRNKNTREFFNSETGDGFGCNPFYGWSTLGYFLPLELEMGYDPTDIDNKQLQKLSEKLNINLEL
jgi:hypothetical protein